MPGRTRHGRKKHPPLGKKRKSRQVPPVVATQRSPVSPPEVPASAKGASTPVAPATPLRYPYISAELLRVGILSGVILAILVALALVLS